jgi:hypothetical protein
MVVFLAKHGWSQSNLTGAGNAITPTCVERMRLDLFWSLISIEKPIVVPWGMRDSGNIDRRGGVSFTVVNTQHG